MIKRLVIAALLAVASLACTPMAALATTYTPCIRANLPVPNDPTVANIWGALLNTNFSLIDTALGGTGVISVAGSSNVVLTANSGASDQSRSANFNFTGALTGNVFILFPQNGCGSFSVLNSTSGSFTLSVGVNNGSGSPVGVSVLVPQGGTLELVSDGADVRQRVDLTGLGGSAITQAPANTMVGNWTGSQTAALANQMPSCADAGGNHLNYVNGTGVTCGNNSAFVGSEWRIYRTGNVSISDNTRTEVVFNNKSFDTATICSTGTGRCTPSVAGKYRVTCNLHMSSNSASQGDILGQTFIYLNGSPYSTSALYMPATSWSTTNAFAGVTDVVSVNGSTDYISCAALVFTSGGVDTLNGGVTETTFSGSYVGQ